MGELLFCFCLFSVLKVFIYIKKVKGFYVLLGFCPTCRIKSIAMTIFIK